MAVSVVVEAWRSLPACLRRQFLRRLLLLRAHVDDPVGRLNHVHVMFDHQDGIAAVDQFLKNFNRCLMSWKCRPVVGSSKI